MMTLLRQHQKCIAAALMVALILPFATPLFIPQKVHAQYPVEEVGPNLIANQQTAAQTASIVGLNASILGVQEAWFASWIEKEYTLDGIAWAVVKLIIQEVVASIVDWINSGFEGSPAFVEDLESFLISVADNAAGDFIYGSELGFLCSEFELDVRTALEFHYLQNRDFEVQCTLSDIVANIQGFVDGDFLSGGWDGWYELAVVPENNVYGAFSLARERMDIVLRNERGEETSLLGFGDGFLSFRECSQVAGPGGAPQEYCSIVSPGQVIEEELNFQLDAGEEGLIVADEINEVIAALIAYLAQEAITGIGGVLGLSGGGGPGSAPSYVAQLANQATNPTGNNVGVTTPAINSIQQAINLENQIVNLNQQIITAVNNAQASACAALPLNANLNTARNTAQQEITNTNALLVTLNDLNAQYVAATNPNDQQQIMNDFLALQGSGQLHTNLDVTNLQQTLNSIVSQSNAFINQANTACNPAAGGGGGGTPPVGGPPVGGAGGGGGGG